MLIEQPLLRALAMVFIVTGMLSMGVQTTAREVGQALGDRRFLGRALLANLVLVPALGLLVALAVPLSPETRLGIALVSLAPGAPFGVQFTRRVKGSTAIAVGLALLLTLIALVYTLPVAAVFLPLEASVHLPYGRVIAAVLLYLALPAAVGIGLHRWTPKVAGALAKPLFLLATAAFLSLMIVSGDLKREGLSAIGAVGVVTMLAIIGGAMVIGWWLGGPAPGTRRVLAVSTSMRNVLISHLIAAQAFPAGNVDLVVLAFFALMIPANVLFAIGVMLWDKWKARQAPGPTGQAA